MSTRNVILGAAATCLAVGSAFASYLTVINRQVRIGTVKKDVTFITAPSCNPQSAKCLVKVHTKNGVVTVTSSATLLTIGGVANENGSGAVIAQTARTLG